MDTSKPVFPQTFQGNDGPALVGGMTLREYAAVQIMAGLCANPDPIEFPLIERGLSHADCDALLREAGITMPAMYRLGYKNNNCIGCVKGGAGYWNKIRRDFPEIFARRAEVTRRMGCRLIALVVDGKRQRMFLDELPEGRGRYEAEPPIECGIGCNVALSEIQE